MIDLHDDHFCVMERVWFDGKVFGVMENEG
jgi:hypothetical protein